MNLLLFSKIFENNLNINRTTFLENEEPPSGTKSHSEILRDT